MLILIPIGLLCKKKIIKAKQEKPKKKRYDLKKEYKYDIKNVEFRWIVKMYAQGKALQKKFLFF